MTVDEPLRVGVVGAGPWAQLVHAPMIAAHPGTTLAGVWARRHSAAAELAARHASEAFETLHELLVRCEAVTFAVPPDVQAELAVTAARAGRALLLEKPLALDLPAARRLADAVDEAGVNTQVLLTWRYTRALRTLLADVAASEPIGGRGQFISGGALAGPFATPWRQQHGHLLDLGPHVIDALDAALGTVVGVRAHGDELRWVGLLLEHDTGLASEASLSGQSAVEPMRAGIEIYTHGGGMAVDMATAIGPESLATIVDEFVATARGTPHPLDVHRGLHLQHLVHEASIDLRR